MDKNALANDLTEQFIQYQWRLENPMPVPNETATSVAQYQNDPYFRAKVRNWVAGVMATIEKHI